MNRKLLEGGCHCGNVRFTALADLDAPTLRCNCSICTKSRMWLTTIAAEDFTLDAKDGSLSEYQFGAKTITHCFCANCGIKTHGRIKDENGVDTLIAVSVASLDLDPQSLDGIQRSFIDGRADRQDRTPEFCGYL